MGVEIQIDGLTKSFGSQLIWGDVTLTVPAGEICVMLGPSGTGKSVLLKTLIGLLKPDRGSVVIEGVDITSCPEKQLYEIRKLFGVLFQDGAMFGSMNLYDNVAFPLREHTKKSESEVRAIVMEKMELVGLLGAEDKLPGEISGGMRKRAGLARALAMDPELLFLDEPTAGLDPISAAAFDTLIKDLSDSLDLTVFMITHDLDSLYTITDEVAVLADKHVVAQAPVRDLERFDHPWIREYFLGPRGRTAGRGHAAGDGSTRGAH
jgi:phospholipid/cholesterol/gamma-HCH transport system ATP-binding protein